MSLIASTRVHILQALDNHKRVTECQLVWKLVLKHNLAFSFETNLIWKYIQSYQTVTANNAASVLLINSNLLEFL